MSADNGEYQFWIWMRTAWCQAPIGVDTMVTICCRQLFQCTLASITYLLTLFKPGFCPSRHFPSSYFYAVETVGICTRTLVCALRTSNTTYLRAVSSAFGKGKWKTRYQTCAISNKHQLPYTSSITSWQTLLSNNSVLCQGKVPPVTAHFHKLATT